MNPVLSKLEHAPRKSREGSVLIIVLVLLLVVTGLSTVSLRNAGQALHLSQRQVLMEQAHFIAESGLERAAEYINTETFIGSETQIDLDMGNGRMASITITPLDSQGNAFSVDSSTTWRGVTRDLRINRVYRPTYLAYGMFFDRWEWNGYALSWLPGDVVEGMVWSGTPQGIAGHYDGSRRVGPIFRALNETAANSFARDPEFASFLPPHIPFEEHTDSDLRFWLDHPNEFHRTNVDKPSLMTIDFDRIHTIADIKNVSNYTEIDPSHVSPQAMPSNKALVLRGRTELRYKVDSLSGRETGIVEVRNHDMFGDFNWHPLYSEALDLVVIKDNPDSNAANGHEDGTLVLGDSGQQAVNVVKGNMTVWVDRDVTLPSSVIYNDLNLEESEDKFAVISKQSIYVSRTNKTDLYLYGGYIAAGLDGSGYIGLDKYSSGGVRGTLHFVGSQVGRRRHPWGIFQLRNGEISLRHGYNRSISFDARFESDPPPFTPTINTELRFQGWH